MSLVQHFIAHQGNPLVATLTITKNSVPVTLTTETVTLTLRLLGSTTNYITARSLTITNGPLGKVQLLLTPTDTSGLVADAAYAYVVQITDTSSVPWTVAEGRIYAAPVIDGV